MRATRCLGLAARGLAAGIGLAAVSYAAYVAVTWRRYGHPRRPSGPEEHDSLLDKFMPAYEVVERHRLRIAAPADITLSTAFDMDLQQSAVIRGIFRARELILRTPPDPTLQPSGLVAQTIALGWGVLAEVPGREIVMGAVTQPWEPKVVFRALPPAEFASFSKPGFAKIVWTLRADPITAAESMFRTETRVNTTDAESRRKFRRYWSFVSPGVILIRRLSLGPLKREAERRAGEAGYTRDHVPARNPRWSPLNFKRQGSSAE